MDGLFVCAVLVGVALFLALVAAQRSAGGRADVDTPLLRPALVALRLGTAVPLVSLAVVEKLANPAMGIEMLEQRHIA